MKQPSLIGHWPLSENAEEIGDRHHGVAHNIVWEDGAAQFNGRDSIIEIADAPQLQLGCDDFTIMAWIKSVKPMRGAFGDVLSKFDAERRCGLNVWVSGGSSGYNSQSDARHVHAGIDDGYVGEWQECGRPGDGSNPLVSNLTVYEGELYAGISDATNPQEACKVFRWDGVDGWIDCGRVGDDLRCLSVFSMIVHDGHLYAGTGIWDWGRVEDLRYATPPQAITRVFRYEGGTTWRDTGAVGKGQRVTCLASFEGELYAGLDAGGGGECYKLQGESWVYAGNPEQKNLGCMVPMGGVLYGSSPSSIYRYDGGTQWTCIGKNPFDVTQIHSLQVFDGKLWAGTWPQGYQLRCEADNEWTNTGKVGLDTGKPGVAMINETNALGVHNGKLYAGTIPKAQVYRYEFDGHWALLGSLANRADWDPDVLTSWMRVLAFATHKGKLFTCTGTCKARTQDIDPDQTAGRVLSCEMGMAASHGFDIGDEWTHIAMIREKNVLKLYVNGELSQSTSPPPNQHFHLGNAQPLRIGAGAQGSFDGAICDVRLYDGVLDSEQMSELSDSRPTVARYVLV